MELHYGSLRAVPACAACPQTPTPRVPIASPSSSPYTPCCTCARFDSRTGEVVLRCESYPTREENRRWCLERLHLVLQAAQQRHPSPAFLFARVPSPFLQG